MSSRLCFVLVIFFFAATLIVAVYLRGADKRTFYEIRMCKIEQGRLQQELWQKQLRVESLINPASISRIAQSATVDSVHAIRPGR
jgi:cytochrome c-type biogenesis protein CcmE